MPFCKHCGSEVNTGQIVCLTCGYSSGQVDNSVPYKKEPIYQENDKLFSLLGFFVPIAGLVLFLIWNDERPVAAKYAGIGALANLIFGVVVVILWFVFIISLASGLAY